MCTIHRDTLFSFMKNIWIGGYGAMCHIMNDDTGLVNVININESIQCSSSIMPARKKAYYVSTYGKSTGLSGFTSTAHEVLPQGRCKPVLPNMQTFAGKNISSIHQNIMVASTNEDGNIVLDCQIKTHDGWVA